MKGFAEPVSPTEQSHSPTASRLSHRLVYYTAVQNKWRIKSLDIGTAFLKGYTFDELESLGIKREPVAFQPCEQVWEILAEISPEQFAHVLKAPWLYVFVLAKCVYGLRDAPLQWHIRLIASLRKANWRPTSHDGCAWITVREGEIQGFMTLHVDDLLVTGTDQTFAEVSKMLSDTFGNLTLDEPPFRHFGVDVMQDPITFEITTSQEKYISDLKVIEQGIEAKLDDKVDAPTVTAYRALVSAIAWVGVTDPKAMTSASLLQGCLPLPSWRDVHKLNANLEGLRKSYVPLRYIKLTGPQKLLNVGDSSFANSEKYSQGGHLNIICEDNASYLCGRFMLLDFKSNKSKRVATSTMHAEALAKLGGLESCTFIQSFLLELSKPQLSATQLLEPEKHEEMLAICSVTDCDDLFATINNAAAPSPSNKHLSLYLTCIREFRALKRVSQFAWIDTRDMCANCLTKLSESGQAYDDGLRQMLLTNSWQLQHAYRRGDLWVSEQ